VFRTKMHEKECIILRMWYCVNARRRAHVVLC